MRVPHFSQLTLSAGVSVTATLYSAPQAHLCVPVSHSTNSVTSETSRRRRFHHGPYLLEPSSPLNQPCVSELPKGSGCPQSMQRSFRPPVSFTSISLIVWWHIGQSGGVGWTLIMMHAFTGGSATELSVTDSYQWRAVMEVPWRTTKFLCWSMLLTFQKLMIEGRCWGAVCTDNLNPGVAVMESAQDGA
jgi:hypothetical protein